MVTFWERTDLLALLCVMFSCVFVTFPYGGLGQEWYLIVLIPDLCLLPYFNDLLQRGAENSTQSLKVDKGSYQKTRQFFFTE